MIKNLVQHGNSKAIVIDKSILKAAGLEDDCLFHVSVDSSVGITIQSVKPINEKFEESKKHVFNEYSTLLKNLANR